MRCISLKYPPNSIFVFEELLSKFFTVAQRLLENFDPHEKDWVWVDQMLSFVDFKLLHFNLMFERANFLSHLLDLNPQLLQNWLMAWLDFHNFFLYVLLGRQVFVDSRGDSLAPFNKLHVSTFQMASMLFIRRSNWLVKPFQLLVFC